MEVLVNKPDFIEALPNLPGVYRFYGVVDALTTDWELLYVGKALNLYSRVKSYFQKAKNLSPRISLMVAKIVKIEITVTENEVSALILENNLIKSLKPKYNIIFRDDKSYPLLRLSKHVFPKLDSFRGKTNSTDTYFGPYPNVFAVKQNLDLIGKLFKLRTCTDVVFSSRTRPCILYEIKRCTAPCVNLISAAEYQSQVNLAADFLHGKYATVIDNLTKQMYQLSKEMEFEKAAAVRDKLGLIKHLNASQIINNYKQPLSADLVFCEGNAKKVFIYLIILRNGVYIGDKHFILENVDNSVTRILEIFLENYYIETRNTACVFTQYKLKEEFKQLFFQAFNIKISYSHNQQVEKLYQMGQINLHKVIEQTQGEQKLQASAESLAKLLNLEQIRRIECIDVSHNQGENTVASLVVYENGKIDHAKYRKYNLHEGLNGETIKGNDLLAMQTVLKRRLASKELQLPDIILVDGGMHQLESIKNILVSLEIYGKIRVLAIFKGERRDPQFDKILLDDGRILRFRDEVLVFRLLQGLRDEAHRFAITGHRKKQVNKMTRSQLADIPNIGSKKRQALLAHFGSVKNVADAGVADLQRVNGIGEALAKEIYAYFH